jgi:minor histocompatibility antigen H13
MDVFHDALKSGKRQKLLILNSYPFHHVILSFIFVYFTMPEANEDSLDRDVKGVFLAHGCIMMMALLTIFLGSFRSLQQNHPRQRLPAISQWLAALVPIGASFQLILLYFAIKTFSTELINMALSVGCFNIIMELPPVAWYIPTINQLHRFVISILAEVVYCKNRHWIVDNLIAMTVAVIRIEQLRFDNIRTAATYLVGLVCYDVFWVFGTDVMKTVAISLDAPLKLVFPLDLLENGWGANKMAMLGLGDIFSLGLLAAFLLQYDRTRDRYSFQTKSFLHKFLS